MRPSNCNGRLVAVVVGLVLVTALLAFVGWLAVLVRLAGDGRTDVFS